MIIRRDFLFTLRLGCCKNNFKNKPKIGWERWARNDRPDVSLGGSFLPHVCNCSKNKNRGKRTSGLISYWELEFSSRSQHDSLPVMVLLLLMMMMFRMGRRRRQSWWRVGGSLSHCGGVTLGSAREMEKKCLSFSWGGAPGNSRKRLLPRLAFSTFFGPHSQSDNQNDKPVVFVAPAAA